MPEYKDFDSDVLGLFWYFVAERQKVWHRRNIQQKPQPWTNDPILRKNKFTNIYRELDPGTEFPRRHILETDHPVADKIFNVMIYRLMCSIPTYQKIGFQTLENFSARRLESILEKIYETGEPVFGNAYLISPYSSMGSPYKYVNVAKLFEYVHYDMDRITKEILAAPSSEKVWKMINSVYGFGPFLAFQVMVDLMYPNRVTGEKILPWTHEDWACLGPGAVRGLGRMINTKNRAQQLEALRWLRDNQVREFRAHELTFPWLKDENGVSLTITLSNMQNCLCEFSKYASITQGTGKAQRLFTPTPLGSRGW